jgi:hypothetical protein
MGSTVSSISKMRSRLSMRGTIRRWLTLAKAAACRHVRRPTSPTTCAAAAHEKARPRHRIVDATVGIKWPGPLPSKGDPRMARARGSKNPDPWPRSPLSVNGHHRCPRSTKITDQRFVGRPGCEPLKPADVKSQGQPVATPQRPY